MALPSRSSLRLLLVDDHALFREGLAGVLERQSGFEVSGQASTVQDGLAALGEKRVDVVLLDVDLGRDRAMDFVLGASSQGFAGRILVVTAGLSPKEAVQLVEAGVAGILHKHSQPEELCRAIREVASGGVYMEKEYLKGILEALDRTKRDAVPLSEREIAVLRLLLQGGLNKEIGEQLRISESSVKGVLRGLFDRLGVRTRSQLVKVALEKYGEYL
ncbi:MAG: response regulator transcription factor [Acidobacteria bacterium]|nr:response regulator transcription factor [Acidobacteriota bacterium]